VPSGKRCQYADSKHSAAAAKASSMFTTMSEDAVTVTNWYKQNVYDSSNNKIGEIVDVLVNKGARLHHRTLL
jgi:hypothetical protein